MKRKGFISVFIVVRFGCNKQILHKRISNTKLKKNYLKGVLIRAKSVKNILYTLKTSLKIIYNYTKPFVKNKLIKLWYIGHYLIYTLYIQTQITKYLSVTISKITEIIAKIASYKNKSGIKVFRTYILKNKVFLSLSIRHDSIPRKWEAKLEHFQSCACELNLFNP